MVRHKIPKFGNVYLIHGQGSVWYKIGFTSKTVKKRIQQLKRSQPPFPLIEVKSILVREPKVVESKLFKIFAKYRKYGEWFEFNERQVDAVCKAMGKMRQTYGTSVLAVDIETIINIIDQILQSHNKKD